MLNKIYFITILWGMNVNSINNSSLFFERGWCYMVFKNKVCLIDNENQYIVFVNLLLFKKIELALKHTSTSRKYNLAEFIYSIKNNIGI